MGRLVEISLACVLLCMFASLGHGSRMVCYFGSWSVYRWGNGKFDVEDIDPFLCTHLMFGFVGLSDEPGIRVLDPWNELYDDWGKGALLRFTGLKEKNPALKTLVAIGGWNEGSIRYSKLLSTESNRATFVKNTLNFVQKYKFDGLDLDWEYPAQRGGVPEDVQNFTELIKALREEFDKHGLLVTAAVAAAEASFSQSYDVKALGKYLHFINVMTYDMHGSWETSTGHNAPLYQARAESGIPSASLNVNASINAWISYGAPLDKLVMGVGMYGRTFSLASPQCSSPRCPATGGGNAGTWTSQSGFMGYNEICMLETEYDNRFDEEAKVPYMTLGQQWISYDNVKSVQSKVDFIKSMNLGGAMIWSLETDDFSGYCGHGKFPLLTTLSKGVLSNSIVVTEAPEEVAEVTKAPEEVAEVTKAPEEVAEVTKAPEEVAEVTKAPEEIDEVTKAPEEITTVEETEAPEEVTTIEGIYITDPNSAGTQEEVDVTPDSGTTSVSIDKDPCTKPGFVRDPDDCQVFYSCSLLPSGSYKVVDFKCDLNLVFNTIKNVCDYPSNVQC